MKRFISYFFIFIIFSPLFIICLTGGFFVGNQIETGYKQWPSKPILQGIIIPSNYINEFEVAFLDRFPFKSFLIKVIGQIEYSVFKVAKEVVVGTDGWLTDKVTHKDRLVRLDAVDNAVIEKTIIKLAKLQNYIENHGGKFVIIVVPLKSTIYSEKFSQTDFINRGSISALDRFQQALEKNKIPFIDLKKTLFDEKSEIPLFYKTDVHWNSAGVTIAAKSIISYLSILSGNKSSIWQENIQKTSFEFSGGEAASIPTFIPIKEFAPRWSGQADFIKLSPGIFGIEGGDTFMGINHSKALIPNTLMFGNSFMLEYPGVGYHNYFKKSQELLDYKYFSKVLDYVNRNTKIYILHLYETQLLFHLMDLNSPYWDNRIDDLPLKKEFKYK